MGFYASLDIEALLARNGIRMDGFGRVLDFGCGPGRVIRYWQHLPGEVYGSDYNDSAVAWCRRHLPFTFNVNGPEPPLTYNDEMFDFIYALSVFTHLDGQQQTAWLEELMRVLRPGGYLMFTTHGDRWLGSLSDEEVSRFGRNELVLRGYGAVGSNAYGAYQSADNVRRELLAGKDIVDYAPWGAVGVGGQDAWLVRKS
jgi:ubiquinone/menaquinone biosynthesis C-methylase UbiE